MFNIVFLVIFSFSFSLLVMIMVVMDAGAAKTIVDVPPRDADREGSKAESNAPSSLLFDQESKLRATGSVTSAALIHP
jgi:hypothetical protein